MCACIQGNGLLATCMDAVQTSSPNCWPKCKLLQATVYSAPLESNSLHQIYVTVLFCTEFVTNLLEQSKLFTAFSKFGKCEMLMVKFGFSQVYSRLFLFLSSMSWRFWCMWFWEGLMYFHRNCRHVGVKKQQRSFWTAKKLMNKDEWLIRNFYWPAGKVSTVYLVEDHSLEKSLYSNGVILGYGLVMTIFKKWNSFDCIHMLLQSSNGGILIVHSVLYLTILSIFRLPDMAQVRRCFCSFSKDI